MPAKPNKKKPMPIILENRLNGTNTVQMAQRLYLQLRNANLSLIELKLIDVYLSRINSHNPDAREVVFDKGELEKLFGVTRIQNEALNNHFDKLMQISVIVTSEEENDDTYTTHKNSFTLFNEAILIQDKKDGLWRVRMRCGDEAAALIFNIDKIGYLQHTVRDTARMSNLNSFLVYKFIESHRMNKNTYPQMFSISLNDLREQLNCVNKYKTFRDFNKYVLKTAQKEIHERTSTRFEYETIYAGRSVSKIKFTIWNKSTQMLSNESSKQLMLSSDIPVEENISKNEPVSPIHIASSETSVMNIDETENTSDEPKRYFYGNSYDRIYAYNNGDMEDIPTDLVYELAAACENEFSPSQMKAIVSILYNYSQDLPKLFKYLERMYIKLNLRAEETVIGHRFNYFYTMIENDKEQGILGAYFE